MDAAQFVTRGAACSAAAAYAWWATGLRPFSGPLTAAVVGAGIAAMAAGAAFGRRPRRRPAEIPGRRAAVWAGLFAALAAWELAAYVQQPRSEHPTLSSLADAVLDPHPVRAAAFLAWLAAAAVLARR